VEAGHEPEVLSIDDARDLLVPCAGAASIRF